MRGIRRREFLVIGGAAAAWPIAARGQQMPVPVIGFLVSGSTEASARNLAGFRKGLSEVGFVEGNNVSIEYRAAHDQYDLLPELAADLVRRRVAVLVALNNGDAARAAKAATNAIPIVFVIGGDPVQFGLVASLNGPRGNVTGVTTMQTEINPKRFGLLHELVPKAKRIGVLVNPAELPIESIMAEVRSAASTIGQPIEFLRAGSIREIDSAFASLVQKPAKALLVTNSSLFANRYVQLVTLATHYRLPAMYFSRTFTEAGGLMSYGPSALNAYHQAGLYVGRVLKGEKPSDLPVMRPTKFELVINMQTARTLGIDLPATLLASADEVIE
jgi:putative ABC transport system substrate-binding protein